MSAAMTTSGDSRPEADVATALALGYLALPNLLFVAGWLWWPVAALAGVALALMLSAYPWRRLATARLDIGPWALVVIAVTGFAWASFGGGSHLMFANHDWVVRDAVLADLARRDWPPLYRGIAGEDYLLRSATGFFLVPALVGKWLGTAALPLAMLVWTGLGLIVLLLLLPLPRQSLSRLLLALLVVVLFSGADVMGWILTAKGFPPFPYRIEWWSYPYSYSSISTHLLWAPNHALPAWIATALVWKYRASPALSAVTLAALPLTLVWSPFGLPAVLPIALFALFRQRAQRPLRVDWLRACAALAYALLLVWFFTLDVFGAGPGIASGPTAAPEDVSGDPQAGSALPAHLSPYLVFVFFEFGLIAAALARHVGGDRSYLILASLLLAAIPWLNYGPSNDAMLRLSIPPLLILCILSVQALTGERATKREWATRAFLVLVLAIGANTPINELGRAALYPRWPPDYSRSLLQAQDGHPVRHYFARPAASSLGWLLKRPYASGSGG